MCSTTLQIVENEVIEQKVLFELAFGIGNTLYAIQDLGVRFELILKVKVQRNCWIGVLILLGIYSQCPMQRIHANKLLC